MEIETIIHVDKVLSSLCKIELEELCEYIAGDGDMIGIGYGENMDDDLMKHSLDSLMIRGNNTGVCIEHQTSFGDDEMFNSFSYNVNCIKMLNADVEEVIFYTGDPKNIENVAFHGSSSHFVPRMIITNLVDDGKKLGKLKENGEEITR